MQKTPQMPPAETSGFVRTLNNMGFMTSTLDACSRAFVDYCGQAPGPALEIGAAYGVATLPALPRAQCFYANDISAEHLQILWQRTPVELRERLKLVPGEFPEQIQFAPESLGAVLIARVLHFFEPAAIERSLAKVYEWLRPGGKCFVVTETPYLRNFQAFHPVYETRKAQGEAWPGLVRNLIEYAPERGQTLPPMIHFLDPEVLSREAHKAGFVVESCHTMERSDFPADLRWDGRESVGLVAVKGQT